MPHPKPAEGNVALIRPPEGAVAAAAPDIKTCTQCHNTKDLVEKTKDVKPTNPHVSPHYQDQLDCTNCHYMHGETENFCDQCHQFGFKVP